MESTSVEQTQDGFDLAGANSNEIIEPVVTRGPIDLNIRAAELSQLIHAQLDSDAQIVGDGIGDAHRAIGPLQAAELDCMVK